MWNVKCIIILAVNGATGVVTKVLKTNVKQYREIIQ